MSLGVIVSLLAASWGYPQLDLVAAIAITVIIARVAFGILRRSAGHLADTAFVPLEQIAPEAVPVTIPGRARKPVEGATQLAL